jgi:hypothetical protein
VSENPYAPPKAVVADVAIAEAAMERPREIKLVVQLGVVSWIMGVIVMALSWDYYRQLQPVSSTIYTQLFTVVVLAWLYYKVYQGRNWARITWLVFAIIGFAGIAMAWPQLGNSLPGLAKIQMLIGAGITAWQFWLLFLSPGRRWFGRRQ